MADHDGAAPLKTKAAAYDFKKILIISTLGLFQQNRQLADIQWLSRRVDFAQSVPHFRSRFQLHEGG